MPLKKKKATNGVFYATGTIGGHRIRQSLGTRDQQQAEEARAQLEARLWNEHVYGAEAVATFEDAALSYLQDGHEGRFIAPLLRHFRGRALRSIKPKDVRDAARKIYPNAGPATMNRQGITPARAVINHGADQGWCQPIRVKQFPVEKPRRVAAGVDWVLAFCAASEARGNRRLSVLCRFMFETGTRISEATNLRPKDIDHINRRAFLGKTKNGEEYHAHFSDALRDDLMKLAAVNGRVFGYKSRSSIYGAWRRTCEAAGIPYVSPHQAGRHSLATMLEGEGWSANAIADAGRWKSVRLVQDTYIHTQDKSRAAADLIGEKLAKGHSPRDENGIQSKGFKRK